MIACLVAAVALLGANAFQAEFEAGSVAFRAGNHAAAAEAYERVVASGAADPTLFYNLATAYREEGRLGLAIVNYERALALRPGFAEASDNLNNAIASTENRLPKPLRPPWQQALLFWDTRWSFSAVGRLATVTWFAFWGLLAVSVFRPLRYGRSVAVLLLFLATLSGLSAWCKAHPVSLAVAVVPAAPVRFGTSDTDEVRFELREGDRVVVEATTDAWVRVRSVDGVRSWVRAEQVCLTGPPYRPAPTTPATPAPQAKATP